MINSITFNKKMSELIRRRYTYSILNSWNNNKIPRTRVNKTKTSFTRYTHTYTETLKTSAYTIKKNPWGNFIYFALNDFTETLFISKLQNQLKINSNYSFLIRVSFNGHEEYRMVGNQIGFKTENFIDTYKLRELYLTISTRIDLTSSDYRSGIEDDAVLDSVEIIFKVIDTLPKLVLKNTSEIKLPERLINQKDFHSKFNQDILPLTTDPRYYGKPLNNDQIRIFLQKLYENSILTPDLMIIYNLISKNIEPNLLSLSNSSVIKNNNSKEFLSQKSIYFKTKFYDYDTPHHRFIIISNVRDIKGGDSNNIIDYYILDSINTNLIVHITDKILNPLEFERTIGNTTLTICNQTIKLVKVNKVLTTIKPTYYVKPNFGQRNTKFGSFDLETFVISDNLSKPFAAGFLVKFDIKPKLFYITDIDLKKDSLPTDVSASIDNNKFKSMVNNDTTNPLHSNINLKDLEKQSDLLVISCINEMLRSKYHNYTFYCHNFGKYDLVFIWKVLLQYNLDKGFEIYKIIPTYRDTRVIKLELKTIINNKLHKFSILDSMNFFDMALDKLAIEFDVETKKDFYPYTFITPQTLNYTGKTPDLSFYNKLNIKEYNSNFIKNNWNTKDETENYLIKDLKALLQIIDKYSTQIFNQYNIDFTEAMTISRLALNLFKQSYLTTDKLPIIKNPHMFKFIHKAYFGGLTEVYKPYGENLIYIDVNSLYPAVSLLNLPGNSSIYLESLTEEGLNLDSLFGFFEAEVIASDIHYLGFLGVRYKDQIIYPNGKFSGVWSSEELKFARDNGYQIKVIKGYHFNQLENVFKEYVEELYNKKRYSEGIQKILSKSLLNNLIGRFGLNIFKPITDVVNPKQMDWILSTRKVISQRFLNADNIILTFEPLIDKNLCEEHGIDYQKVLNFEKNTKDTKLKYNLNSFSDISITTTAMVNSYAKIFMHKIKLNILKKGGQIYYSDTDSLVLDKNYLLPEWIGPEIGKFKVVYDIEKAYFISNKTYCLILTNGEVIIKSKGVNNNSLNENDFKSMFFNKTNVSGIKQNTITNYNTGSVILNTKKINLNYDSYTKRHKIYDNNGLWINTKPLNISTTTLQT